jgi:uncharacterized protein YjbI with pentapeptide repeats
VTCAGRWKETQYRLSFGGRVKLVTIFLLTMTFGLLVGRDRAFAGLLGGDVCPVSQPVKAPDETFVKKLLETKVCPGCDLTGADLSNADLNGATLDGAILRGAQLREAKLNGAHLDDADLSGARMNGVHLENATLLRARLIGAGLQDAHLSKAELTEADLTCAILHKAEFKGAEVYRAVLTDAQFEPESLPNVWSMRELRDLQSLTWKDSPRGLILLRKMFKESGLPQQERDVTYALMREDRQTKSALENALRYVFFELTSAWGASPGRPLFILIALIPPFALIYFFSIAYPTSRAGVWQIWDKERTRPDIGQNQQLSGLNCSAAASALYFSVLSAFFLGWRDLNVGNWLARLNPEEYSLRGTGWVRTMSGVQSLISVYLLALTVLSYFGRPFE